MRGRVIPGARKALTKEWVRRLGMRARRRPKGGGGVEGEEVPVEPNRPDILTGGAAAALEFDD